MTEYDNTTLIDSSNLIDNINLINNKINQFYKVFWYKFTINYYLEVLKFQIYFQCHRKCTKAIFDTYILN